MHEINVPVFTPRWYQIPALKALDNGCRNILLCWGRRSGKDCFALNALVKKMVQKVGVYFYILPTYAQAKKVIFDSITNDGFKMLNYIPPELRENVNSQEMKITLKNGSIFQLIGSKNYDSLMGTNAVGFVISEYALQDPQAYEFIRPIMAANPNSWQIVVSTPRGKNHFWDLYQYAKDRDDWFVDVKTSIETGVITQEFFDAEIERGADLDHLRQEYLVDFNHGATGSYYSKFLDDAMLDERIGNVAWQPSAEVNVSMDLGYSDNFVLWFWQEIGASIHFIDYYANNSEPIPHYVKKIREKPYLYDKIIVPHDADVHELSSGMSRVQVMRDLGLKPIVLPRLPIMDGIEAVRSILPRCWFDEKKCAKGLKCLSLYRKEWNDRHKCYNDRPLHDSNSDSADSMRYAATAIQRYSSSSSVTPKEIYAMNRENRRRI